MSADGMHESMSIRGYLYTCRCKCESFPQSNTALVTGDDTLSLVLI